MPGVWSAAPPEMGPGGVRQSLCVEMGGVNTHLSITDGTHAFRTPGSFGGPADHLLLRRKQAGVGRGGEEACDKSQGVCVF